MYSKDILAFLLRQEPHTVWLFMERNDTGTRFSGGANSKKALASKHSSSRPLVSLVGRLVACSARIAGDTQIHTETMEVRCHGKMGTP